MDKDKLNTIPIVFTNSTFFEGSISQMLESTYILENTSNWKVFLNADSFLRYRISQYRRLSPLERKKIVYKGLSIYKKLYPDREVTRYQSDILLHPISFDYKNFISQNVLRCFKSFCSKMEKEMIALKTEKARDRRRINMCQMGQYCIQFLVDENNNNLISEIVSILNQYNISISFRII